MEFVLLEHPADIGVLARGTTRAEALVAASKGLASILVNPETIRGEEERKLRASGSDEAAQIVSWLNEILFYFDTEGLIFADFSIDSWSEQEVVGRAWGKRFDPDRHEFRTHVKAVTYHQFESVKTADGWEIRFFVDV